MKNDEKRMLTPLLTEEDPAESSEGTVDPLGMEAIADSLARKLVPGVRERQRHPRFLTAMAVSLEVCKDFDEEVVAKDGVSEPWQVFEWHMVEGLVRTITDKEPLQGLPGHQKVARAMHDRAPVCARRYLSAPSVAGFHGVYRLLATELRVQAAGRLGEFGDELLRIWAEEQGLVGFSGTDGDAERVRRSLASAVSDGLEKGAVNRTGGWEGWEFFGTHLSHRDVGTKEGHAIVRALMSPGEGFRNDVFRFLVSPGGIEVWTQTGSERAFHEALAANSDQPLKSLVQTIMSYETFTRLMEDAFFDCLYQTTEKRGRTSVDDLCGLRGVVEASKRVPELFVRLMEALQPYGESSRFRDKFQALGEPAPPKEWAERLLKHHQKAQQDKPPNGKAPWFDEYDDGSYMIRTGYRRDKGGRHDDEYVYPYRTNSLWSFAHDLGRVK